MLCGLHLVQVLVIQEVKFDVETFSIKTFKAVTQRGQLPPDPELRLRIKHLL